MATKKRVKKEKDVQVPAELMNRVIETLEHMRDDEPDFHPDENLMHKHHKEKLQAQAVALLAELDPDSTPDA